MNATEQMDYRTVYDVDLASIVTCPLLQDGTFHPSLFGHDAVANGNIITGRHCLHS